VKNRFQSLPFKRDLQRYTALLPAAQPAPTTTRELRKLAAEAAASGATAGALTLNTAGVPATFRVSGLPDNTPHVAYFTARDQGNDDEDGTVGWKYTDHARQPNHQPGPASAIPFTTTDGTPPKGAAAPPVDDPG
jgi:hypothetical protein